MMQSFLKDFKGQLNNLLCPISFPEPFHLKNEVENIKMKFDAEPTKLSFCDLDKLTSHVYSLWNSKRAKGLSQLGYKERRCLPWIFHIGEDKRIIDQIDLLKAILKLFNPPKSFHLKSLIHVYLMNFDRSEGTEILRQFIFNFLKTYAGQVQRLKIFKSKINFLFTKSAVLNTTNWILLQKSPNACLEELSLKGELSNSGFVKQIAMLCLKRTEKDLRFLPVLLSLLTSPSDSSSARFPEIIPKVATTLIPEAEDVASKEIQDALRKFFIKYLGDPRLPGGRIRWKKVSEKAQKIFIQWLSKQDIRFFFSVVEKTAKDPNWKYRRRFWEAYLPHIEKTWVVLGPKARALVRDTEYKYGNLRGASRDQSVFLIKMRNYVFLEWSHSGACRVYKESDFPWKFGQEFYYTSEIYRSTPEYKQVHRLPERYHWQKEFAQWILQNLHIYPKDYFI